MKKILLFIGLVVISVCAEAQDATITYQSSHKDNHFGWAITGNGYLCCISDPRDSITGYANGCVNIYKKIGESWEYIQTLRNKEQLPYDYFGYALSMHEDMLAVSAIGDNDKGFMSGGVYIYKFKSDSMSLTQTIFPPENMKKGYFGKAVKICKDYLVVGAPGVNSKGCIYLYSLSGDTFQYKARISPADLPAQADFGASIDYYNDTVFVGAPKGGDNEYRQGMVYIYARTADNLIQVQTVSAGINNYGSLFGYAVSAWKNKLLVSAPHAFISGNETFYFSGKAFLFEKTGSNWGIKDTITDTEPSSHDLFGSAVSVRDSLMVISEPRNDDLKEDGGKIFVYKYNEGKWQPNIYLINPVNGESYFGNSLFVDNNTMMVGVSGNKTNKSEGTVYYYIINENPESIRDNLPEKISIYPNPVSDKLTVEITGTGKYQYKMFDPLGRLAFSGNLRNGKNTIPVSGLVSGIYMLSVSDEKNCYTAKIEINQF